MKPNPHNYKPGHLNSKPNIQPLVPVPDIKGLDNTAEELLKPYVGNAGQETGLGSQIQGMIYVPEVNLHFTETRQFLNKNYPDTQALIPQTRISGRKIFIPMPRQFRAFLKFLRNSRDASHQALFKDITEKRDPYRANRVNARFEQRGNAMWMISEHVLENGDYTTKEQMLQDYLAHDKKPGISLDSWIDSTTSHGLPPANISSGELWYWQPVSGRAAGFLANSGRSSLSCLRDPQYSFSGLGVFVCAEGAAQKK